MLFTTLFCFNALPIICSEPRINNFLSDLFDTFKYLTVPLLLTSVTSTKLLAIASSNVKNVSLD